MKRSILDKVKTSLWMLPSFVGLINGLGFIYIGRKMSNRWWILEGAIYELPWIFGILNLFDLSAALLSFSIGSFMVLISTIRSVMVNYEYQRILDEEYGVQAAVGSGSQGLDKQVKDGQFSEKVISTLREEEKPKYNPFDLSGIDKNYDGRIKFESYKSEINDLKKEFDQKNNHVKELVEKRFTKSQITYDRFMSIIENSEELFNSQASYALEMIDLTPEYTEKIDEELQKKIDILRSIIKKTDALSDELIINMTTETGSDIEMNNHFEDMEHLTGSIKDYHPI